MRIPFVFVRHGDPPPLEWLARHPGWVKIPAVMIPRNSPHHPANGGPYPTFHAPPPAPRGRPDPVEERWPFGKPVAASLRGAMSRIRPGGVPPQHPGGLDPGGLGAPPGTPGARGNTVAAFLGVNAFLDRLSGTRDTSVRVRSLAESANDGGAAGPLAKAALKAEDAGGNATETQAFSLPAARSAQLAAVGSTAPVSTSTLGAGSATTAVSGNIQLAASYFDMFGRPNFTVHAIERMNQIGVSPGQLNNALQASPVPGTSPGTMNFKGGGVTAVVNEEGMIVTVY